MTLKNEFLKTVVGFMALSLAAGCVAKKEYVRVQSDLALCDTDLKETKSELDKTQSSLAELQGIKPELAAKAAALESANKELSQARSRLNELDETKRKMEESLKSELADKTIKIEQLKDRLTVTFVDKILFDTGSAKVKENGKKALLKVAQSLKDMHNHWIYVQGHTDDRPIGSDLKNIFPTNWELSTARATAVVRYLQDAGQIEPERLYAVGRSYYEPLAPNATPENRSQNRRVEIILIPKTSQ